MGLLIDGIWRDEWYDTESSEGRFIRSESQFRNWVTKDGAPGPSGTGGFKAEAGRYHLYVSHACPWANRTMIYRSIKGLEKIISLAVVHWHLGDHGWTFEPGDGVIPDPVNNAKYYYEVYTAADPEYTGRVTVPALWDKRNNTIVSNESSEIIRMFNSAFDDVGAEPGDYYPEYLRDEIDSINSRVFKTLNNGVYRAGFATTQEAYEEAVYPLFDTLDWLEESLQNRRYLAGSRITEADWRLFTTLIRFDPVYVSHFKCDRKRLVDYPNLWAYTRDLHQQPGVAETVNMEHIRKSYFGSHSTVNPTGIVPIGPEFHPDTPHERHLLSADGAGERR